MNKELSLLVIVLTIVAVVIFIALLFLKDTTIGYQEKFEITGEITQIDTEEDLIYLDEDPVRIKDTSKYEVGQRLEFTLIDTTSEDRYLIDDFIVKEIKVLEQ